MTGSAIDVTGFSFSYQGSGAWQLAAVTTHLARGERLAIMGATGAGKSTLAMALNGLIPHHHDGQLHGTVTVDGIDVRAAPSTETVRHVGLVMQDPETQITGQTVLSDAAVGPANLGLPKAEVLARAEAALELVDMAELGSRDATALSGGQKQRLAIAGIIAMEPGILVLDEPTSELDPQGTREVYRVVNTLSERGDVSLVMIDHEPEIAADWADRLVVLAGGRVVFDGAPTTFFSDAQAVEDAALRPPQVAAVALALQARGDYAGPIPVTLDAAARTLPRFGGGSWLRERAPEPVTTEVVIAAHDLGHTYAGGVDALSGVDVEIRAGEYVAILGRNGAGKTTFARHLNGLLRPTRGSLLIAGEPTADRSIGELATRVGYVFQNPDHQIFANSVRAEVAYGLENQDWAPDRITARVDEVLARVGMLDDADRHPFTLGKGQRQRLAVASVLALAPDVLVIDEPTTGQDHRGAVSMMQLIRELNDDGHTILMITHDMTLVAEHARRALVFAGGRLLADTTPHDLFGSPDLLLRGNLLAPQVTELAAALGASDTVTTVDEYLTAFEAQRGVPHAD